MIVDCNVSIDEARFPVDRALEVLASSRIGRAIVSADPRAVDLERQNQYVLESARRHDLIPFFYIGGNPYTDTRPDTLEVPDNFAEFAGLRWHRWIGEAIDRDGAIDRDELDWAIALMESSDFEAVVSAAAHYGMPVFFEESLHVTVEFALRYPSLDVIIPHMGSRSGGEANILRALWDAPNVYFETSLGTIDETTLARLGTERLLFGSGLPEGDPEYELDKIDRLPVSEDVKEGMYGDNVLSLLAESRYDGA